jgi:hypothetical protein
MMRVRDGTSPNDPHPPFFASCCISLFTGGPDTVARRSSKT